MLFEKYRELVDNDPNVIFDRRLGTYKYYDMDKVIDATLEMCIFREICASVPEERSAITLETD